MNREKAKFLWQKFLHWPGWTAWLHWKGWTAWLKWDIWKKIGAWRGWKRLFVIHPVLVLLIAAAAGAGLFWVFLTGREEHCSAVPVYVLAAYGLTVACTGIPGFIRGVKRFLDSNALARLFVSDRERRFSVRLYCKQIINAVYGIFKTAAGALLGTAWIGADGLYNLTQAGIQLIQILRRKKVQSRVQQWKSYRLCGWLILAMHLTITGLVFQMTRMGRMEEHPGYLIFVTALFAFYKLISAFVHVAKDRKNEAPIDSSVMLLDLAQALFSLFSLQVSMIHRFEGSEEFAAGMNTITGTAVCVLVMGIGIYMLRRSRREIKKLEEERNGEL